MKITDVLKSIILAIAVTVSAFSLSGCALENGEDAFYSAKYQEAIRFLKPIVNELSGKQPTIEVAGQTEELLHSELTKASNRYFRAYQAYIGSWIGLKQNSIACDTIRFALRPIRVTTKAGVVRYFSPKESTFWQAEVKTIRSWNLTLPCE